MKDLNSTLFYKVKFNITSNSSDLDLLWVLVSHIRNWQTRKWNYHKSDFVPTDVHVWTGLKNGGTISSQDKKSVYIASEVCSVENEEPLTFWACKIVESKRPIAGMAPREWVTEIGFKPTDKNNAEFSCVISYSDRPGFIGECEEDPYPSVPNIIQNLIRDKKIHCWNGIDAITIAPVQLTTGEWLPFSQKLSDPDRTIPYIYISPRKVSADGKAQLVDPERLAIASGGNAVVFYSDDTSVTDEMDYYCPAEYKCFDGAVRVYYPQVVFSNSSDSYRHRFLPRSYIEKVGEDTVVQMIRRALAQDVHFYETVFRIEDCKEMRASILRKKRLAELVQTHIQQLEQLEEKQFDLAVEEEEKRIIAEEHAENLQIELDEVKETNYRLSQEVDMYRPLAIRNAELEKACRSRLTMKCYPKTIHEIVSYFETVFGDRIAFSEDAIKSIKRCSIQNDEVWKVFYSLATDMYDLYISGSGDIYKEFRAKTGIDVSRGEGTMTRQNKRLMRQYETYYNGDKVDVEAHITYPRIKQSIHFGFSPREEKVIIGWCGEHKDNFTTQSVIE